MSIHEECLKEYKCEECNIESCDYCMINCEYCEESFCGVCNSLYRVIFDDKPEVDMCGGCKESLETIEDLIDYDGEYEIVKIDKIFDSENPYTSIHNMICDLVGLIVDDINNIKKYEEKNSFYFEKKYVTYEMILFELMETNLEKVKFYINYIKNKIDIKKALLNETKNRYEEKGYVMNNIVKKDILDYMIELGGDVNIGEKTCLIRNLEKFNLDRITYKNFDMIKYLIENKKVDVNKGDPLKVITSLSKLEKDLKRQEIVKMLLKRNSKSSKKTMKKINFLI